LPWEVVCGACGHTILAPAEIAYLQSCLHFQSCHSRTHKGMVFDNSREFISLDYHKRHKEVVFFVSIVSKKYYEEKKLIHSVRRFPKTVVY